MDEVLKQLETNKIYYGELIRENARLTIQHEADLQVINGLLDRVGQLEAELQEANVRASAEAVTGNTATELYAKRLVEARHVIEWLMAGGDPCKVCATKCLMGTADGCEPKWNGNDVGVGV